MPFDGNGLFQRVRNWVADATAGIKIRADMHDSEDDGFAAGLTNCITKDGQTLITQNIPFNNKRITGLADPVNAQDAATKAYTDTKIAAGGVMTGDLIIRNDAPDITLDATGDTGAASIGSTKDGKQRWLMRLGDGSVETGTGNAGSNFDLQAYADDGSGLGRVLYFDRATGLGFVKADPVHPQGIVTKTYADAIKTYTDTVAGARVARSGDTMTGALSTHGGGTGITNAGLSTSLIVYSSPGVPQAYMSFYAAGVISSHFGLAEDGNFYMGGMSHATNAYKFWTTRDFAAVPTVEEVAALRQRIEALESRLK